MKLGYTLLTMKKQLTFILTFYVLLQGYAYAAIYDLSNDSDGIVLTNVPSEEDMQKGNVVVLIEDEIQITDESNTTKAFKISTGLPFSQAVIAAAKKTEIEPALLHAVMLAESNFNPKAVSNKGARGLMQLMPDTARRFKVANSFDPAQNIMAGAMYLKELRALFKGDKKLMLAAYNAGPANVIKYGAKIPPFSETMQYVPKVMNYYQKISASASY